MKTSGLERRTFIVIATLVVVVSVIVTFRIVSSQSPTRGWFWNAMEPAGTNDDVGLGWTSLNCVNDFDNDGQLEVRCSPTGGVSYGVQINDGGDGLGGAADYVDGCAWSAEFGWVCFGEGSQCPAGTPVCDDLDATGVAIAKFGFCEGDATVPPLTCKADSDCSAFANTTCTAYYYHLDSTDFDGGGWQTSSALASDRRASILSLWESGNEDKAYISFPFSTSTASTTDANEALFGCFSCDSVTGKCGACLNVSTDPEDPVENPAPNLLCYNCGNDVGKCAVTKAACSTDADCAPDTCITACRVSDPGGSCINNRDKNSCLAGSCEACTTFTGVIVNQSPFGEYEMCGWGYHAYDDGSVAQQNIIRTLDDVVGSVVEVGRGTDIAISPTDQLPVIAYVIHNTSDASFNRLKVLKCGDPSCKIKTITDIDAPQWFGFQMDIAVDSTGLPVIAYRGLQDGLEIAKCKNPECTRFDISTVDATSLQTGQDVSMVLDANDRPIITYYYWDPALHSLGDYVGELRIAHCANPECSSLISGSPRKLDDYNGWGGLDTAIALDPSGNPIVSYFDADLTGCPGACALQGGSLKIVKCANDTCTSLVAGSPKVLDDTEVAGYHSSIAYDADGLPIISYDRPEIANLSSHDRLFIRCSDVDCTSAVTPVLLFNTSYNAGEYGDMAVGGDGKPVHSYFWYSGQGLEVAKCNDKDCSSVTRTIVDGFQGGVNVGWHTSIAISADGNPIVSYYDLVADALKVIKCTTASCATSAARGLGWMSFNPSKVGSVTYARGEGSVFSGGSIYSPAGPPVTKYNSAYTIEAGGDITNWFSQNLYRYPRGTDLPKYLADDSTGVYSNVLGKLDVTGLTTDVISGLNQSGNNKYGSVMTYDTVASYNLSNTVLDDTVTVADAGTVTVTGGDFTCNAGQNGAGILVVNGDLIITGDITYDCPSPAKLSEIPSAVWIVKGDVTIDPVVENVAGTFIVLGDGNPIKCPADIKSVSNGCGRFNSGSGAKQLKVTGSVIARQFKLDRSFSDAARGPAELFVSDGRLQANTPPGLFDFSKSVPRFTFGF